MPRKPSENAAYFRDLRERTLAFLEEGPKFLEEIRRHIKEEVPVMRTQLEFLVAKGFVQKSRPVAREDGVKKCRYRLVPSTSSGSLQTNSTSSSLKQSA